MTREEATRALKMLKTECGERAQWVLPLDWGVAFDMAIEALSAEPSDLISRAEAIDAICDEWCYVTYGNCPHCDDGFKCDGCDDVKRLESLPSADRPSGEWQQVEIIDDDEPSGINTDASQCSVCGVIQQSHYWATHYYSYCPSCGARMENTK